jgi:hypothetical protein
MSTTAQFTEMRLRHIGSKHTVCSAYHTQFRGVISVSAASTCFRVEEKLENVRLLTGDELFDRSYAIFADMDQEKMNRIFQVWMQQIQEVR